MIIRKFLKKLLPAKFFFEELRTNNSKNQEDNNNVISSPTLASQLHKLEIVKMQIEGVIEDAYEQYEPEISNILDYYISSDYYDNSIEIYFNISLPYPYEPCAEIRQAIFDLGFNNVYWNFNKDTMDVVCDRFIGQEPRLVSNSRDEVRNWEPRHVRDGHWELTKYGYVDNRFNEQDWLTKYNFKNK